MKLLTQKKYQDHVPCSFAYKVVCIDDRFTKPIVVFRGENATYKFIKAILKQYKYCKNALTKIWSWVKKKNIYFNKVTFVEFVKNLLMIMMKKLEIIVM